MKKLTNLFFIAIVAVALFSCNGGGTKSDKNDEGGNEEQTTVKSPFDEAISGTTPVVVDFYADWCKPCQIQGPIIEEFAAEMGDKVKVIKVNVDNEQDLAERYGIESIPTIMIFKENKIIFQAVGVQSKETLMGVIEQL